jgi:dihydrolipoamide dehydrogenase
VIGLELGSVWARLGAEVVVIEACPTSCSRWTAGLEGGPEAAGKQGLDIRLNARVTATEVGGGGTGPVRVKLRRGRQQKQEEFDRLIVAVGGDR